MENELMTQRLTVVLLGLLAVSTIACRTSHSSETVRAKAPERLPWREADRDISCEASSGYIGNVIDLDFSLTIAGPKAREWKYTCTDRGPLGRLEKQPINCRGTYVLEDDLAVFTGSLLPVKEKTFRFGLNFGFHDGEVQFDRFFPVEGKDKVFSYHRKWFERRGAEWQPVEEVLLTLSAEIPKGQTWEVKMHGTRTAWAEDGTVARDSRSEVIVYHRSGHGRHEANYGTYSAEERTTTWFPGYLAPFLKDGRLLSIRRDVPYVADIRGFHPRKAIVGRTREETSVGADAGPDGTRTYESNTLCHLGVFTCLRLWMCAKEGPSCPRAW